MPATWSIAPSRSMALRSGIFVSAIWRTWSRVTLPGLVGARVRRALLDARGLTQEERRGRRLGDERERPVLVDRDLGRDHEPALALGRRVVRLAEVHDVDPVRAERGAHRGAGVACPAGIWIFTIAASLFFAISFTRSCEPDTGRGRSLAARSLLRTACAHLGRARARRGSHGRRCSRAP